MPNTSIGYLCGCFGSHVRKARKGNARHADNPKYYITVQLYVKKRREERRTARDQYLKLVWAPGEVQVDFGEADFIVYGKKQRVQCLVADFPFYNVGLSQVFYGENAECACRELFDIFSYPGGVPTPRIYDVESYNKRLLDMCMERLDKNHYAKGESERCSWKTSWP